MGKIFCPTSESSQRLNDAPNTMLLASGCTKSLVRQFHHSFSLLEPFKAHTSPLVNSLHL